MTEQPITLGRQRELIERLTNLAARRATEGAGARERDRARSDAARQQFLNVREQAIATFERQHADLASEYKTGRESILSQYEADAFAVAQEEEQLAARGGDDVADSIALAKSMRQQRAKEVLRTFRDQKNVPRREYAAFKQRCMTAEHDVNSLVTKAQNAVRRRCAWPDTGKIPVPPPVPGQSRQQYVDQFSASLGRAQERLAALQNIVAARFIEDGWPWLIFLGSLIALIYPSYLLLYGIFGPVGVIAGVFVGAAIVAVAAWQAALPFARRQTLRILPEFQQAVAEAYAHLAAAMVAAKTAGEEAHQRSVEKRDAELAEAKAEYKRRRREAKAEDAARIKAIEQQFVARRKSIEEKYERQLDRHEQKYPAEIDKLERDFSRTMEELRLGLAAGLTESRQERDRDQQDLTTAWSAALVDFQKAVAEMNNVCDRLFATWESIDLPSWKPPGTSARELGVGSRELGEGNGRPVDIVSTLRFGRFGFEIPDVERENGKEDRYELPAVLSFPECPSLLLEAEGEGREAASRVLQNVMLRLLTTFPPGKVRFTIIDPVGLGQNFSAFMHLADYDEKLVSSRIWTEGSHINQKLADLTEHMENVIQKYLRNEFASIQEYNQLAGEVAEPFQILVIANFPANCSEEAARRLASIATSGARCGVYTLMSVDMKLALPRNFDLADIEAQAATLVWDSGQRRFRWKNESLRDLPLTLESPPDDARFTELIRTVGRLAKDAARVEVPFEMVTPPRADWWKADSRGGVDVPLGRSGAKNLQYMRLGKGTSQHVLISGKTGSGKSTLLNAMITNLAMHYSPDELQFYLIDFKKGVEFKAYASCKLPHARVIAIESEREFGMSVLERLDQELKARGDLFRKAGVQDVKGYRNATEGSGDAPVPPVPRVLLIIDEFQEFFTSDDRIAHDAALLLDRLVRQGRAFGIHVLLGSQTLSGAYSLARSTLGQMAVRIALQCSETDSHLILSEDNTAARLLSRPGEAIYNDANGLFEGNHPFQVVWLSDSEREEYLRQVAELAEKRQIKSPPPIVFEGNAAADPSENLLLKGVLEAGLPAARPAAVSAWLGSAVAIKDPTDAVFRAQSGSNLLVVGQQDELALGLLSVGVMSLAAQLGSVSGTASLVAPAAESPARLRRFYILDGTRPDAPEAGFWNRLCRQTQLDGSVIEGPGAAQTIGELADEVNRRLAAGDPSAEPIFLIIYNLARFRDLKKADDFSFDDEGGSGAGKKLATILREGPSLGVHTLVWCDSYNNANRWLDRQTLRDFEMRVLFQMSATDSSNLMDSPAASRLGGHTAIFYSEERGEAEKFRPYGLPPADWLAQVARQLPSNDVARGQVAKSAAGPM